MILAYPLPSDRQPLSYCVKPKLNQSLDYGMTNNTISDLFICD